jgi:hypothetical protein
MTRSPSVSQRPGSSAAPFAPVAVFILLATGLALLGAGQPARAQAPSGMSTGPEAHMSQPPQPAPPGDAPAGPPSTVDVLVAGQGVPIEGAKVTLAPDVGKPAEQWNTGDSKPLGQIATDASGHVHFAGVPPGRYIVTTGCGVPGNWIAGNYASRIEAFAGRAITVTLTMRRGGMVRGKALQGDRPVRHCDLRAEAPDALMSTCGMMSPSLVDTATGGFTITKVPLNANMWIKASIDQGDGQLGVWKAYTLEKPDTLDVTLAFPTLPADQTGTLVIHFRPSAVAVVDSGSAQLTLNQPDGSWRYETSPRIAGRDTVTTVKNLPAGGYQIRPYASVGEQKWWNAPIDSVHIMAGKTTTYIVRAQLR